VSLAEPAGGGGGGGGGGGPGAEVSLPEPAGGGVAAGGGVPALKKSTALLMSCMTTLWPPLSGCHTLAKDACAFLTAAGSAGRGSAGRPRTA
jgi:hypothetical protein